MNADIGIVFGTPPHMGPDTARRFCERLADVMRCRAPQPIEALA